MTKNKKTAHFFEKKSVKIISTVIVFELIFLSAFLITTAIIKSKNDFNNSQSGSSAAESNNTTESTTAPQTESKTTEKQVASTTETTTEKPISTSKSPENTTKNNTETHKDNTIPGAKKIDYPSDDASWLLICLNRYRYVDSTVENTISLKKVAGTSQRMDTRAAEAYNKMYDAASLDGIYLTPCSGYRSYSRQYTLYYEYVNDYIAQGKSETEAHNLASRRRNPPGSSEHNIGICMDIICAATSANFQNTKEYRWLVENAQDYGYILRYPEDKTEITGVKFEPWHWRYVGVANAKAIKNSGLCLEEYLGLA